MTKIRTYQKADIHGATRSICTLVNTRDKRNWLSVQSVVQVERIRDTVEADLLLVPADHKTDDDWVLTERWVDWDKGGEVMGATRIIASTAHLDHARLHFALRSWMWGQSYMLDFGPSHCDVGLPGNACKLGALDDNWYRETMVPEYKRRFLS
jgi:hypothetical protein